MSRIMLVAIVIGGALSWSGCGGSGEQAPPPPQVSALTISPTTVSLNQGATQAFTANLPVTWTVEEGAAGGAISGSGLYTAPLAPGTYHVQANSVASGTATAVVIVASMSIQIQPASITLPVNTSTDFAGLVFGSANDAVTWSLQEGASGGTIGFDPTACFQCAAYTAPPVPGVYHVIVASVANPNLTADATVTVVPPILTIFPAAETLGPGGTRQFSDSIQGLGDQAVTWTVQEGAAGGSISSAGLYTAPATPGTYHVIATSIADNNVAASSTLTIMGSGFKPTGSLSQARSLPTATLLQSGRVLVAGGSDVQALDSAELYDPVAATFSLIGSMTVARSGQSATLLNDGRVLLAGGVDPNGSIINSAEVYDPATGTFSATGALNVPRTAHTATLLTNGTVLISGGLSANRQVMPTAEIYHPLTGSFSTVSSMAVQRYAHTATLLTDGRVLIVGGNTVDQFPDFNPTQTAELFDPNTGMFSGAGSSTEARAEHSATLLPDGRVFIAGNVILVPDVNGAYDAGSPTTEIYDPATSQFSATANMTTARGNHVAMLLANGEVLLAGGVDANGYPQSSAELFDPTAGTFATTGGLQTPLESQAAVRLQDGRILVVGGSAQQDPNQNLASTTIAETYR